MQQSPLAITGLGCLSALGHDTASHLKALSSPAPSFRTLSELEGPAQRFDDIPAAWIEPRKLLAGRKWSPAANASLHAARQAIAESHWTASELEAASVIVGTSRGTAAGWHQPWPGRRAFPIMAACNSLSSEPAAAISHELGIQGAWHTVSNGCCSGLDALGMAALWIHAGLAERVLVVACDLPLVDSVLDAYDSTGILARGESPGMIPAEGAVAVCLEPEGNQSAPRLTAYRSIGEPAATLGTSSSLPGLRKIIAQQLEESGTPTLCIPHASGTPMHAKVEGDLLHDLIGDPTPTLPLKPFTGHCIGVSGLLEVAIACAALRSRTPLAGTDFPKGSSILKIASAMGGKHSLALIDHPYD